MRSYKRKLNEYLKKGSIKNTEWNLKLVEVKIVWNMNLS